jgi:hypothetical protein
MQLFKYIVDTTSVIFVDRLEVKPKRKCVSYQTMLRNETKKSFILQMDYKNVFDKMEDERRLLQFVSELILNKTRFNDIDIVYDQITNDFVCYN